MDQTQQQLFMKEALREAHKALAKGEVPIGAVVVWNGKVIARAHNNREQRQNAVNHAELLAISKACKKLGSWRLDDAALFVTLEPCLMCAGAAMNARMKEVYFAVHDTMSSLRQVATGSKSEEKQYEFSALNHTTRFCKSELESESKLLLQQFFKSRRKA